METVERIVNKHGGVKRISPATKTMELIEAKIGFRLPEDYSYFAEKFVGFEQIIGIEFVKLWDIEELIDLNTNYQIFSELGNMIGIGSNGAGEFIAIEKTGNEEYRIVISSFISLSKEHHLTIGDSFTDFLIRLENGIAWFD